MKSVVQEVRIYYLDCGTTIIHAVQVALRTNVSVHIGKWASCHGINHHQ